MSITVSATPNPHAMKFSVGQLVGDPRTFVAGTVTDDPVAAALLAIEGVASVFMTSDFVTLTKYPEGDWDAIVPAASETLETAFG